LSFVYCPLWGVEPKQAHQLEKIWKLAEGEPYDATYVQKFMANTVVNVPGHKWRG
jgi:hypothetical protein